MNALVTVSIEQTFRQRAKETRARLYGRPAVVNIIGDLRREWEAEEAVLDALSIGPRDANEKNHHVLAWRSWMEAKNRSARGYAKARSRELGSDLQTLSLGGRDKVRFALRSQIMWEIKTIHFPDITFHEIGRIFGGRDHSSVFNSLYRHEQRISEGNC